MEEYFRSLLLVGAVAVLAGLLLPEKNDRMRRMLEFALSLLVLTVICRPLAGGIDFSMLFDSFSYPSSSYEGEGFSEDTMAAMERAVADGIERDLAVRYGIPSACVQAEASLSLSGKEMAISALTLTFSGEGKLLDLLAVRQYAEQAYQTSCEVKTDGG